MSSPGTTPIETTSAWQALSKHQQQLSHSRISDFFANDPERFKNFSLQAPELLFDYSKHLISSETIDLLLELATQAGIGDAITAMFKGDLVNNTEKRPALHVALRSPHKNTAEEKEVHTTLSKIESFVAKIQCGEWTGFSGKPITDVINIGIGGSDLGPAMVYEALSPFHSNQLRCHFVSNVDPCHLEQTLTNLNPETTLFVIASKTFTTLETLQNANAAKIWLQGFASDIDLTKHFVAVSSKSDKAIAFGIDKNNIFPLWDWVGGRYSLWSAIGLPIALGTSMQCFRELLSGAHAMDEHFRTSPLNENMPVLMALLNLWYLNFFQVETQAILPYIQNLHLFPAFLQQLDMESLGKSVTKDGDLLNVNSGGLVWGSAGTNGQHSFHQLLHQGKHIVPADFIASASSPTSHSEQHRHLLANCFAQSQALMQGKSLKEAKAELATLGYSESDIATLAPHKVISGNKPSSTIMMQALTASALGALIASYEHKVYVQSVVLGINAFDQWGVELGKQLSAELFQAISSDEKCASFDASTNALINYSKPRIKEKNKRIKE
ncbi:MAG: glucose-6-phosphate isomerase [SAR86 cluster bacterium]|uniref:Glucose-6-phosphate isomerase n=1 Tax=SAR86 cluster bacterium TaxID=2030880 RepID=A0A2A5CGS4_9GAMM|nr:MAG: glucose-6-phosphate isomerase [SAR86 cluster bacterium]